MGRGVRTSSARCGDPRAVPNHQRWPDGIHSRTALRLRTGIKGMLVTRPGCLDRLLHPPARRPGHLRCPPRGCSAALRSVEAKRSFFLSVLPILIDGGPGATPGGFAGLRLRKLFQRRFAEKLCGPSIAPCPHTADPELHVRTEKKLSGATERVRTPTKGQVSERLRLRTRQRPRRRDHPLRRTDLRVR